MIKRLFTYVILIFLIAACSSGPEADLAITDARVITGTGEVLENGTVLIKDDNIHSVKETRADVSGARQINADGKTVLPGLIDAHVHLTIPADGRDSTALAKHMKQRVPEELNAFWEQGITTIRSTGGYWPAERKLRNQLADGQMQGPRMITSGPILTNKKGHPVSTVCAGTFSELDLEGTNSYCRSHSTRVVQSPDEARKVVQQLAKENVDFIKVVSDTINAPIQIDDAVIKAIVKQADKENLKTVGHVAEVEFAKKYASMGMDGFVHFPWNYLFYPTPEDKMRQLSNLLADKEVPVIPTLSASFLFKKNGTDKSVVEAALKRESRRGQLIKSLAEKVAAFAEAGVPIVVGTDYWTGEIIDHPAVQPGMITITEMKMMRWGGMSQKAIIEAATANAAKALEMSDRIGTLESGKLADMIVVNGNPLEDLKVLKNVVTVIKDGEIVVDGESSL